MKRIVLFFLAFALLYAGAGLLPGRTFAPVDLLLDSGAWKSDPSTRVRVSNSQLSDVVVQFIAWDREVVRLVREGQFPWTNRFAGQGAPLFANPQTALLSPFTWPRLLLGLDGWAVTAILKLLAAAMCAYWFARELAIDVRPALLSATVFAASGFCIVWLLYPPTNVFVLLPGLGAAALRCMKQPSRLHAFWVLLLAALCTAGGHPEALFLGVVGLAAFLAWKAHRTPGLGARSLAPVAVGAGLGFLMHGVQLVPFLHLLARSHAATARPEMEHTFRFWSLPTQVLPGLLGSPVRGELDLSAVVGAGGFHWRAAGFIGAIVLIAILGSWRALSEDLRRGWIVGLVALALSWHPPGVDALLRQVPVVRMAALEYGLLLFCLFASMAAGPALVHLGSSRRKALGAAWLLAGMGLLVGGVLPALPAARPALTSMARSGILDLRARGYLRQPPEVYEERLGFYLETAGATALRRVALPGGLWVVAGAALVVPMRRRRWLLAGTAVAELLAFGLGFNPAVAMDELPPAPESIAAIRRLDPGQLHGLAANFEIFPANAGTLYGVRDAASYDVLTDRDRARKLLAAGYDEELKSLHPDLTPGEVANLASLGVRWVLGREDVPGARRLPGPPSPAVGVYEIEGGVAPGVPLNRPPAGLAGGIALSIAALISSLLWLRFGFRRAGGSPRHSRRSGAPAPQTR
jgi:hypothetical protein